jgi:capsular exopolysaccharide synthesis family protein
METHPQLVTSTVDLMTPTSRFASSSRLYGGVHRWLLVLRRFWWIPVLAFGLIVGPAYLYTSELPPAYQSKARLWLTGRLNLSEGRIYTEELIDYLGTQAELLGSPTVQQRALARLQQQMTNQLASAANPLQQPEPRPGMVHRAKSAVKQLLGRNSTAKAAEEAPFPFALKVTESSKTSLLELRATGREPASTRAFLNCLIEEYFVFKKETREKASDRTMVSVTTEVRQLAEELKTQQERLHAFQSSNNVVFLQEQGNSAGSYLAQLNRQIATLRTQLQLLQLLEPDQWIDAESRRGHGNSGEALEASAREAMANLAGPQGELFRANQQMQLLKLRRDELARFLRPEHPKIRKLDEDIATQMKLVQISRDEARRQLVNRRQSLQWELKNLEAAFAEWDTKAIESSRKIADYDRMRLDLQRLQTAHDRLLGVMQNVDVGKTVDQENLGVLEPASVARPVNPMLKYLLAAFVLATAVSLGTLYCLGLFDDRFASITELSSYLSEDVLGQVPAISLRNPQGKLDAKFMEKQRFEFLEAFRNIRSSLLFMGNTQARPKTILITSSVPKEGKSTVALYLSATLAIGQARVLLIDADMRRASLHRSFAIKQGPGLAEILNGEASPACAVVPSGLENLALLPAGLARRNPGELVLSPEWLQFVQEIYPQYDFIIVDSPPLLATDDAACLAPKVDGVMMVVRGSYTSARMARRALDCLRHRNARVLGLVFNRAISSAYEYQYYSRYQKPYAWRPESSKRVPEFAASAVESRKAS